MNTVKCLGNHVVALALVLFSRQITGGEVVTLHAKSGTSAATGPVANSCILADDNVMGEGSSMAPGYPILWNNHLTGADLAGDFTRRQDGLVSVPYGTHEYGARKFSFLPASRFNPTLTNKESYADSDEATEAILLAPPPVGTSASAFYQYSISSRSGDAPPANGPRIKLLVGDSLFDGDVKDIGTDSFPYTPIRTKWQSDENLKKYADHLLLLAELSYTGFPSACDENKSPLPVVYAPDYGNVIRGNAGPNGYRIDTENDLGKYFAASAVSNLMAITPAMPHAAITEWVKLTSYKENVAFVVQGIGTLNAYLLARVAARLKRACLGQDFVKCEQRIRTNETARIKILDFEDEALQKYNESTLVIKNATASCDEKKAAFKSLRESVFLSPFRRNPREALARVYESEKFSGAARYFRFGKDDQPYLTDFTLANRWNENEQVLARQFFRNKKSGLLPAIEVGMKHQDPDVRQGAVQISSALPDKEAIDVLNALAGKKDWAALEPMKGFVATESWHGSRPSKKFPHYVVIAKRAIEDLRANGGSIETLKVFYQALNELIAYGQLTLEQQRHLIDYISGHALTGGTLDQRVTAVQGLGEAYRRASTFEAKYRKRALLQLVRQSTEVKVITPIIVGLGQDPIEKKHLITLLAERQEKVPELAGLIELLLKEGWAK